MKKTLLLSLSLSFLLHAEDDGFYMSAGYQIGEVCSNGEKHQRHSTAFREL